MPPFIDLTGRRFARLTVIGRGPDNKWKHPHWYCRCDCGKETLVDGAGLRKGTTRSCGCYNDEVRSRMTAARNTTHGHSKTPTHTAWNQLRGRCLNPNNEKYPLYGGRGITICERWNDFANFLADMGERPSPKHSLDRIDANGPYSPENCRWATQKTQQNNRRNNRLLTCNGETLTLMQWSERTGFKRETIERRLELGWPVERALSEPPDPTAGRFKPGPR